MRRFIYFSFIVLTFIFVSCEKNQFSKEENIKVSSLNYSDSGSLYKYKLEIPEIENGKSEDIAYFNLIMQENMRYILDNLSTKENDGQIKEASISFENSTNSFGVLSISVLTLVKYGEDTNISTLEGYNINLKDESILTFDTVFKNGAVDYINMLINDKIAKKEKVLNKDGSEVVLFENVEADVNNAVMTFEGNSVVFTFQPNSIAPYSDGMPVFKFSKKQLKKYLNL